MQLEIDCIEWVLGKIEVNKIPNDKLDSVIRLTIKVLEKKKGQSNLKIISSRRFSIDRNHNW